MALTGGLAHRNAYGDELRQRREARGWTQEELGTRAVMSRSHIAHIEAGRRFPTAEDAVRLDQVLETGGVFRRFLPDSKLASFFAGVAQMEPQAVMIREFAQSLVPGLLQTPEYTAAVFAAGFPRLSEEQCADSIRTRRARADILDNPMRPELWALLDETVLRRTIGGPSVMAAQLRHIRELGARQRIRVHVLPFGVGAHALLEGSVTLMRFDDMAPLAYVEGLNTGTVLDSPAVVERCLVSYDLALGDALSHRESLFFIRGVEEEYEHAGR
ncbi:Scr1 family TA system antitoxin-like transcriptional regulator [Streptomyces sp. NPDC057702]|uniref:helix-turn-helix domain-containing protein n=1 Tax=unclassified Streptomyces TaxID=2593676 RepID=UPI003684152E